MVTGHNYQPQKCLLAGYISFLASQNIGNKVNSSLCLKGNKNLRFTSEDLDVDLWMRVYVSGQHDLQTKFLARQVNCYSGWTLSVDWLFFLSRNVCDKLGVCQQLPGCKKNILTASHSGKLELAFTSSDVISTSPKSFLKSRIDYTVLVIWIPQNTTLACRAS